MIGSRSKSTAFTEESRHRKVLDYKGRAASYSRRGGEGWGWVWGLLGVTVAGDVRDNINWQPMLVQGTKCKR